jgi:S1-C subfamily serine protease
MGVGQDGAARGSVFPIPVDLMTGVVAATPISPAERAGLRQRDPILQVNGVSVESRTEFYRAGWRGKVGDPSELIVSRGEQNLRVVVGGFVHSDRGPRPG